MEEGAKRDVREEMTVAVGAVAAASYFPLLTSDKEKIFTISHGVHGR